MQRWPLFCAVGLAFRPNRLPHFSRRAVQVSATEKQESAVAAFKMITEDESKVRKAAGVGVGVVTGALYSTTGLDYGSLAAGLFGAISTYRTGAEYQ